VKVRLAGSMALAALASCASQAESEAKQYAIVARSGSAVELCTHAGLVAQAYLAEQNEERYRHWKQQEAADCAPSRLQSDSALNGDR